VVYFYITFRDLFLAFVPDQLERHSIQCSWTSSLALYTKDFRQPDLAYSRFRQSLKNFLFGQWDQSAV